MADEFDGFGFCTGAELLPGQDRVPGADGGDVAVAGAAREREQAEAVEQTGV